MKLQARPLHPASGAPVPALCLQPLPGTRTCAGAPRLPPAPAISWAVASVQGWFVLSVSLSICLVPVYLFSGGKSHIVLGFYRDRRCPRWQVPCGPAGQSGVLCRAGFLPEGRCPIVGAELSGLSSTCKEPDLGTSAWSAGLGCAEQSRQASRCLFFFFFFSLSSLA